MSAHQAFPTPLQAALRVPCYLVFTYYPALGLAVSDPHETFADAAVDWADRMRDGHDSAVCEVSLLSPMIDLTAEAREAAAEWFERQGGDAPEWCGGVGAYGWESINRYGRFDDIGGAR